MPKDNRDSHAGFLLLNDSNFSEWAMWMEAELIERGLWDQVVVEVDESGKMPEEATTEKKKALAKRTTKKMAEAWARMISRVEMLQLVHLCKRDPMTIWTNIMTAHRVQGLATRLAKQQKFLMVTKGEGESITAWTNQVKGMVFDLEDIGGAVMAKDIIIVLTMGLDTSYDHFVTLIDAMLTEELTVDHIIAQMLDEETRHGRKTGGAALSAVWNCDQRSCKC